MLTSHKHKTAQMGGFVCLVAFSFSVTLIDPLLELRAEPSPNSCQAQALRKSLVNCCKNYLEIVKANVRLNHRSARTKSLYYRPWTFASHKVNSDKNQLCNFGAGTSI